MKTICVKCAWYADCTMTRVRKRVPHRCYAPWPKNIDKVTGKMEPAYVDCNKQNNGKCVHFKPKWYVRAWNHLFKLPFTMRLSQ